MSIKHIEPPHLDAWLEANYRKVDDKNQPNAAFTTAEIGRSMHRGYPFLQ